MNKQLKLRAAAAIVARKLGVSTAAAMAMVTSAMAELPTGVGTAITGAQTDGTTAVGLLAAFGAAVFLIYKVLKRLGII